MLRNNRILMIILFIIFSFFTLFSSNVMAFNSKKDYNYISDNATYYNYIPLVESSEYYNSDYDYFLYYNFGERKICVVFINKSNLNINPYLSYLRTADGYAECFNIYFSNITDETLLDYHSFYIDSESNKLVSYSPDWIIQSGNGGSYIDSCTGYITDDDLTIAFNSSFNNPIYTDSSLSTVFLSAPTRLGMLMLGAEPGQIMMEILKILPLILVVVVSLIGLRKALQMLFKLLRQS